MLRLDSHENRESSVNLHLGGTVLGVGSHMVVHDYLGSLAGYIC